MSTETAPTAPTKQSARLSLMVFLILLNLILVIIILKKQSQMTAIRAEIKESNQKIAEQVLNSLTDSGSASDSTKTTFADSVQNILTNLQENVEKSNNALAETVKSSLANMQAKTNTPSGAVQIVQDTTNSNNTAASEQALTLAEQAWRNNDSELATIYILNALNHNPANVKGLQFYYNILGNKRDLTIADIDQLIDILDVSVYQVSPGDVSTVLSMRNALFSKQEEMINTAALEAAKEATAEYATTQRALREGRLSSAQINRNGQINKELLDERIETIAALLSEADMNDSDRSAAVKLLNDTTTFKLLVTTLESAENAVSKANVLASRNALTSDQILLARNQLQTANTYLAQIWTIDTTNFQAQLNAAENMQSRIANIDKRLDVLASAPARATIESELAKCRNLYGSYTSRINQISKTLKDVAPLLAKVPDLETRQKLESTMEEWAQQVDSLTKARYKAYQEWAAGQINAAIKEYNSYNVVTDGRATNMFNNYLLSINTGLLLPDLSTFYNDVYQKIYNELPKKAENLYNKATYSGIKQLEDF